MSQKYPINFVSFFVVVQERCFFIGAPLGARLLCSISPTSPPISLVPRPGVTIFHTNCSNDLLVSIGRSEMSYPKISKCPQMSINLPKCPKISNFPFKISKNLPKSQNVLSKIQNVLSKIQNVLSKIPKSNLVDVATTPANQ